MEKSVPGESDIKEVLFKRASSAYTEKVSVLGQAVSDPCEACAQDNTKQGPPCRFS